MDKTILIFCNKDSGIYDFRKELLQRLVHEKYQVVVSTPEGQCSAKIRELGCIFEATNVDRRGMNPIRDMRLFRNYLKLIQKYRPKVILTYTIKPNIYGGMAGRLKKIPCIANITGLGTTLENGGAVAKIAKKMYKVGISKNICTFFQNEYNLKFMKTEKIYTGRCRLLAGSGVNIEENYYSEYPSEYQGIRILSVMRIMKDKGIEEFVGTIQKIKGHTAQNVHFDLLGNYEPEEKEKYKSQIEELEKDGILTYWGYREDAKEFMQKAHMIVHPTYHEGMSNVLLEAAAIGRMVVATDIPGCRETVVDGKSGILCKPKDTESLYEALQKALHLTKEEREQMGKEGRQHVEENFDRKKVVDIYMEEIDNIINANLKQKRAK